MKTLAELAFEAKKPLEIVAVERRIEIDPMLTHVLGMDEINTAFDVMPAGKSIRSVAVY